VTTQARRRPITLSPHSRNIALVVAAAFFMQLLDGVIIVTALPKMAVAYGVDTLAMSVGVTIYMLAAAIVIPASTWYADRFGARRVFVVSIVLFTLASIGCALSPSLVPFAIARAVQGAGGAMMAPLGRLLVLRNAEKSEIVPAIGLIVWPALFAPVLGPVIGGFLTTYATWQWNFWINVPLGIVGVALVLRIIPRDEPGRDTPFDWGGFVLCGLALTGLLYGFDTLASDTLPVAASLGLLAVGVVSGIAAIVWLPRQPHPLLDLTVLKVQTFLAGEGPVGGALLRVSINATPFLLPLLFQIVFGLDPFQSGGLVMAYFLGNLAMKSITTRVLNWFGFRPILVFNGVLAGAFIALCGIFEPGMSYALILPVLFIAGLTRSMQFTALQTIAFADINPEHRSSASTLSTIFQQIAAVLSVALATGVLQASGAIHRTTTLTGPDFAVAFVVMGSITIIAALGLVRLPRDAGSELSGQTR